MFTPAQNLKSRRRGGGCLRHVVPEGVEASFEAAPGSDHGASTELEKRSPNFGSTR